MSDLKNLVERIEGLEDTKRDIQADIKDIYAEAKDQGYNTKILRQVIKLRRLSAPERELAEEETKTYLDEIDGKVQPQQPSDSSL